MRKKPSVSVEALVEKAFTNVRDVTEREWQIIIKHFSNEKGDFGIQIQSAVPFDDGVMLLRWWKHTSRIVDMNFKEIIERKTTIVRRNLLFGA